MIYEPNLNLRIWFYKFEQLACWKTNQLENLATHILMTSNINSNMSNAPVIGVSSGFSLMLCEECQLPLALVKVQNRNTIFCFVSYNELSN